MLNIAAFATCIRENLKDRRFGKERADEIIKEFETRAKFHMNTAGRNEVDASTLAMREVFDSISERALDKARGTASMLAVQATNMARVQQGLTVDVKAFTRKDFKGKQVGPKGSRGTAIGHAVKSLIEADPRFTGMNYETNRQTTLQQAWALFGAHLDKYSIGAFGRLKGKAHGPNIIDEMFGQSSGDATAKELAGAWGKAGDLLVDLFVQAGGSMKKLAQYVPQPINSIAKMVRDGEDAFVSKHLDWVDWEKTRWEDGSVIAPEDREGVLRTIFTTKTEDGANKIDPTAFRGRGRALGNMLDNHRFLHYKDASAWKEAHAAYGDGTVFDVMSNHLQHMSHKVAALQTFGRNPELTFNNLEAIAKKAASDAKIGPKEMKDLESVLQNKVRPMMDVVMHRNPMNPDNLWGAIVTTTANLTTSAVLGSASIAAVLGDFATSAVVRSFNKMPVFKGMDTYLKTIATDKEFMRVIANQSGFIHDQSVQAMYSATRFNPLASVGPAWSKRVADVVLRSSLLTTHTTSARWMNQMEHMGYLNRLRETEFDALPVKPIMERYGITKEDWDFVRKNVKGWTPGNDVPPFLRPIDILQSKAKDSQALYRKFQGMVLQESKYMVPDSTIEATVALRGNSRPDTVAGTILYSFSMFKNFPLTFYNMYGRLGMTANTNKGRLGFYASMGAATTIAGVLAVQLNELKNGRDPLAWDDPRLYGKGFLKGGGAGIWGDFLFSGVNQFGQGPEDVAAGPLFGVAGDAFTIALGDAFGMANEIATEGDLDNYDSKTPERLVQMGRRYTPGSNLWHVGTLMQRGFWDAMEDIADPKAAQKRRTKMRKQENDYGNEYFWPLGEPLPQRAPKLTED